MERIHSAGRVIERTHSRGGEAKGKSRGIRVGGTCTVTILVLMLMLLLSQAGPYFLVGGNGWWWCWRPASSSALGLCCCRCSSDGKAALVNGELSPWGTTNERTSSCECSKMYIYLLDPAGI